jgi:hypothetical protein
VRRTREVTFPADDAGADGGDAPVMTGTLSLPRRTGAAAVTAGTLMLGSVAAELVLEVQRPDGSVVDPVGFAAYLGVFTVGAAALAAAVHGLRDLVPTGSGRTGRVLTTAGAALLATCTLLLLLTGLATGQPLEAAFLLFLLGFVLLVLGAVPLALGLRRSTAVGPWWTAVLVAGAGGLVAMTTQSPVHEVGLFTFDAAWAALGLGLLAVGRRTPGGTSRPDREAAPSHP